MKPFSARVVSGYHFYRKFGGSRWWALKSAFKIAVYLRPLA
jgi:hypothetical protein